MATVRIYQPAKTTMQSGMRNAHVWVLTFDRKGPLLRSSPMGWVSEHDMNQEVCLKFPSLLKAIEYSKLHRLSYTIHTPSKIESHPKSYENNFTCPRIRGGNTHYLS